ncbi:MAG: DUF4360 domain-containing protein [Methylotenera sp.]|nr:DUF4360 domain-containing protein [Oligoflexia bacterium]
MSPFFTDLRRLVVALLILSPGAMAQTAPDGVVPEIPPGIQLGLPIYGGTGCPVGSISATLSPNAQTLTVLFDQFTLEAGKAVGKATDARFCHINIPFQVPKGYNVSIVQGDYRGFLSLPAASQAQFDASFFMAGSAPFKYGRTYRGAMSENYTMTGPVNPAKRIWSPCGQDIQLNSTLQLSVSSNAQSEQALFTLDSADLQAGMVYQLDWKACNMGNGTPPPRPLPPQSPPPRPLPPRPVPPRVLGPVPPSQVVTVPLPRGRMFPPRR